MVIVVDSDLKGSEVGNLRIRRNESFVLCDPREVQGTIFVELSQPSKLHNGLLFYLENTVRWIVV